MPQNPGYKLQSIKMEDIQLNIPYSLTINASKVSGNIKSDHNIYRKIFNECIDLPGIKSELFYEFSPIGRLHVHGNIVFTTPISVGMFYQNLLPLGKISTFSLDTITDSNIWSTYIVKQKKYMKPYLNSLKLPYRHRS
jgi:hypothetical protein